MSYLNRKMVGEKLAKAAKAAARNGDELLSACLLNIASVYMYGRDDCLTFVAKSAHSALRIAKEERHLREGVTPAGSVAEGDDVDKALTEAAERANVTGEEHLAGVVSFAQSLRSVRRADMLERLYDIARDLSDRAVGRKSEEPFKDALEGQIRAAIETASANQEFSLAALLQSTLPIRMLERPDLMQRLAETAYNFSGLATGRLDEFDALAQSADLNVAAELKSLGELVGSRGQDADRYVASTLLAMSGLYLLGRNDLMLEIAAHAAARSAAAAGIDPNAPGGVK